MADPTTNTLRSANDATLTIRVIKSFTYRTVKPLVLHHLDLTSLTIGELKEMVRQGLSSTFAGQPGRGSWCWRFICRGKDETGMESLQNCYIRYVLRSISQRLSLMTPAIDTLKLYTVAHGHKVRMPSLSIHFSHIVVYRRQTWLWIWKMMKLSFRKATSKDLQIGV